MDFHSALRLMRLAYNSILLSATDTRKCRALIMVSFLHFGQNRGKARSSVCLSSCNLVFAPQQGQMTYGQAAYQQPVNPFTPPQPVYAQPQQPAFSEQQPSQGYVPDHEGAEYNSAVM